MPPLSRRDFLIVTGAVGAAIISIRFELDRILHAGNSPVLVGIRKPTSLPTSENPMPSNSSSLVFASGYASAAQAGIHAYLFDEDRGALIPHGSYAGILNPSFICVHPNGRWLYAVSETGQNSDGVSGGVCALTFEREPFAMRLLNRQPSGGDWPCHLQLDRTGHWLFVANYGTGNASVYPIQVDGSLGEMSAHVQHMALSPGANAERQAGPHAHSVTLSPDNQFALVADLGLDQIVIYKFDPDVGKLIRHTTTHTRPGAGPRHLAFHPNGQWLYVTNELDNTVTYYLYDDALGTVVEKQSLSSLPAGPQSAPENGLADIHVSASGKRVYASNRGHNSLAVFDIGDDGRLTLVSIPSCGGNWPRSFALAPGGKFALVANQYSHEVCVLPLLIGTDAIGATLERATLPGAACIKFA
ncbi:MAG: lactonase family protein [Chloroflexota bacterium]